MGEDEDDIEDGDDNDDDNEITAAVDLFPKREKGLAIDFHFRPPEIFSPLHLIGFQKFQKVLKSFKTTLKSCTSFTTALDWISKV